ncbi:PREDICTED: putative RNA-binding protein Luc7-like 1 isoform X3 [Camelina sativa]|uniref:RNA-binding protein Luc7-like 1 isoform X3 n=1 Tax=Camelina sativa TaxID=90675 RepID=A0ABM0T3S6_CAMSA|nr:PREDICTED: putative RNA-binding protein Luc7-like 1 isoform X3 [Camelina sativa]
MHIEHFRVKFSGSRFKMDMGPCPKVHSLQLRKEYKEAKAKGVDNYDRELEDAIDRLIIECDRKIGRALNRLQEEDAKAAFAISVIQVTQSPEILELSKQIKEKMKEADLHDLEGKMDPKIRALELVEEMRIKRADLQAVLLLDAFNKDRASLPQPVPAQPPAAVLPSPDPRTQEMINEKLKKAEELGEQGMVDDAQKALEEAEALKKVTVRQEAVVDSTKYTAADVRITDQKLRLCDICGAFLSVYDSRLFGPSFTRITFAANKCAFFLDLLCLLEICNRTLNYNYVTNCYLHLAMSKIFCTAFSDRRLADHFGGKLHLGYMLIRDKLAELQEEKNKVQKERVEERRSKERSREREPSKDRDGGDIRDRGRDVDRRSRDRDRHHDHREHDRNYNQSRGYDSRSRRSSRSRSRERQPMDYDRRRRHDRY